MRRTSPMRSPATAAEKARGRSGPEDAARRIVRLGAHDAAADRPCAQIPRRNLDLRELRHDRGKLP